MALRCYMSGTEGSQHHGACVAAGVKHVLLSYLYIEKNKDFDVLKRRKKANPKIKFMIDSGAHSFQADKKRYDAWSLTDWEDFIKRYISWLRKNREFVEACVELDIDWNVGANVVESWQNKYFIPLLAEGHNVIFVWHIQRGLLGWEEMCSKFPYVGLPGELSSDPDFNKYVTTARRYTVRMHAFAGSKQSDFRDWPWYCMTEEHEILTKSGWKFRNQLQEGDKVLTYFEGKSFWKPVLKKHVFSVESVPITCLSNRNFYAEVTHNHKWISNRLSGNGVSCPIKNTFTFRTTNELDSKDLIPRSAVYQNCPKQETYSDAFVELVAWVWTEGCFSRKESVRITLSQSFRVNPKKVERIRSVLVLCEARYCEWTNEEDGCVYFQISGGVRKQLLSVMPGRNIKRNFIFQLTKSQLKLFVKVSVLADGSYTPRVKTRRATFSLGQKRGGTNIGIFELACILSGIPINNSVQYPGGNPMDFVSSSNTHYVYANALKRKEFLYTGSLWCISVENQTFLTRCNGKVYWTGNSVDSTTWKSSERYGILIHWDEPAQKLVFEDQKSRRHLYRRNFEQCGLNADAIIADTDYKEVTKYALISMRRMEEFYARKYKDRLFYYDLRLPHPRVLCNASERWTMRLWGHFRPEVLFRSHAGETQYKVIRRYLAALAAVQYGEVAFLQSNSMYLTFLKTYFPKMVEPNLADPILFKKELAIYTSPPNPPPLQRLEPEHFAATNNPPKNRDHPNYENIDLDYDLAGLSSQFGI
jgi:hypothetical protein